MAVTTAQHRIEKAGIYGDGKPSSCELQVIDAPSPQTHRIFELASELDRDLGHVEKKRLMAEIREIRRSLVTLESDLLTTGTHSLSDAC
jgi:hypothetical protein